MTLAILKPTNIQLALGPSNIAEHIPLTNTPGGSPLNSYRKEVKKQAILKALEETRWNRTAAAEKLDIPFRQIRHRLEKFGIV
jgi:two-component system, NtrC family, response regulator PilR